MDQIVIQTNTASRETSAPRIVELNVVPVAGHDGMLMNLSGAHGPFFTRNVVILRDNLPVARAPPSTKNCCDLCCEFVLETHLTF